jgi:hypothetical protein
MGEGMEGENVKVIDRKVSHGFLWALRKSINKAVGHF